MSWPFGALKMFGYDVLMVDPPWPYELRSERGESKSYARHYGAMPIDEIAALPVGQLARDHTLLWLWAISSMLPEALAVLRAWGFVFKAEIVWRKVTRSGKVRWGTGYRIRTMHEPVLLGTIGNPRHAPFPSLFDGLAREHSRKPDEAFALVEKRFPCAWRAELFSRQSRPGWDTWGLEAGKFDPVVRLGIPRPLDNGAITQGPSRDPEASPPGERRPRPNLALVRGAPAA